VDKSSNTTYYAWEDWLKSQVEKAQETIQLLEHKKAASPQPSKKGLFGRLIGAINND